MLENNILMNISFLMVESILEKFEDNGFIDEEQKKLVKEDVRKRLGAEKQFSCVMMDL